MEPDQYELMFRQEERHWWYVGMRSIGERLLDKFFRPDSPRPNILDAGCGSGGTTVWLRRWGGVSGVDIASEAVELARRRGIKRLLQASVQELPFLSNSFDLVTSFDVLYHSRVNDDTAGLAEFCRVLRPGGLALVRVPAHDSLRGAHDRAVHTRHRYQRDELITKLHAAGFVVEHSSYANSLLFPLARAKRLLDRGNTGGSADLWRPPLLINAVLVALLRFEAVPIAHFGVPWGLSVIAVGRKPGLKPNVQRPTPNIQRPASKAQRPTSSSAPRSSAPN